ncbi:M23 peptidase domain protein [Nautilia profundicola AmH]|uniref:M23 peptidase domain protein n=1 Tax=Nautilia profundicola (strain ATCC BAA-1463 / DSM 18972 / AmH) TaxID=598659 RepID=B9L8I0_NAUPA|nr:peptidoglycan DD-metalloendopeptidase family protein [Nautilia profundicola]ACM93477.1 M23 peptidase domain protein [Nautilia profundicola AmH]
MKKLILIFCFIFAYSATITSTKKELKSTSYKIARMNQKLDSLAKEIIKKQNQINLLKQKENKIQQQIIKLENELKNSNKTLNELTDLAKGLNRNKEEIKSEVIKFISQNYYLNTKQIDSLNDLIYSEINEKALEVYSKQISALLSKYKRIDKNLNITNNKIKTIKEKKQTLIKKREELAKLKKERIKELASLKKQKENYKRKLLAMIKKQQSLRKKLQELKIVKKRAPEIKVKKVGSAYYKPKTAVYRGRKTIPPVYGRVVKRFGSYIDPIYKIKIYNDSITIKTKPNSVVRSIMNGKVVYIGNNGDKKVVFIKHSGNLFSIYANLSKISPLLKKGSYVKRGQIIARVKDALEFEVTYKDKPINPLKVINLR